ncbi:MAG TPA: PQQ-binding-like beta-propeller repeat protein [Gaiellaceae bacterium]|nr:PQQ-binding-like beta-propeller repeat protein [Gaiellaceae bacterium]
MRARRWLPALLVCLPAALVAALAWVTIGFLPVREAVGGPFDRATLTPLQLLERSGARWGTTWSTFGASPARTRYVPSALRPPFRLLYRIPGRSLIEMPPAVTDSHVVFGTHDGEVVAARVEDGSRAWETSIGGCIASAPAVRGDVVYVGWAGPAPCGLPKDGRGGIVALSLATGELLWRFSPGNVESSPAVVGDLLVFAAFESRRASRVFALSLTPPRRVVWSYPLASKVASSPTVVGRTLYVGAYDRQLYAFDVRTGRLRWTAGAFTVDAEARLLLGLRSLVSRSSWTEGGYYATPAAAYNRVYVGVIDGVFSAFDARTGSLRWSRVLDGSIYGSAAVWNEHVYVGTTAGAFYALSARDGRVLWQRDLGGKILGSPTVSNRRVYVSTTRRETWVLFARTGEVDWRFADGYYSPLVVAGERAYLVGKGRIYALANAPGERAAVATTPAPRRLQSAG